MDERMKAEVHKTNEIASQQKVHSYHADGTEGLLRRNTAKPIIADLLALSCERKRNMMARPSTRPMSPSAGSAGAQEAKQEGQVCFR